MQRLLRFFIQNPLLVKAVIVVSIVGGFWASFNIHKKIYPSADMEIFVFTIVYPGASSSDVEMNAVVPFERDLAKINGIKEYSSIVVENGAIVYAYLNPDAKDKKEIKDEVYRKINKNNITGITEHVDRIEIFDANPKLLPVLTIGVSVKDPQTQPERKLFSLIQRLEKRLLKVPGVADVEKEGFQDREIHINVNPRRMKHYYVSLNDIVRSIRMRNIRATGGTLQSLQKEKTIVTIGQFADPLEVGEVIIRSSFEKQRVRINDLARVKDDFKKAHVKVRVNQKPGVVLKIIKTGGADTIATINRVKAFLKKISATYQKEFELAYIEDQSLSISSLLSVVISNAAIGFALVVMVLFLFLDLRTSFWTAAGIPVSFLAVLLYMYLADISINYITLAAIITVLGMLVDHGIVIAEVVHANKEKGMAPVDAVLAGVPAVLAPVVTTILTTIVAFLPLLSIKGMLGKVIDVFPVIVSVALLASFIEAAFILPTHLVAPLSPKPRKRDAWVRQLSTWYSILLEKLLRWRYAVMAGFAAIFGAAIIISWHTISGFVLFWDDSSDGIFINLEGRRGAGLEQTEKDTLPVEKAILRYIPKRERVSLQVNTGHHTVSPITTRGFHKNWSQIIVNLVPKTERDRTAAQMIRGLRRRLTTQAFPAFVNIRFQERVIGPPLGEPIDIKVIADVRADALRLQKAVEKRLAAMAGVNDIINDQKKGNVELRIRFDYERLAQYGISVAAVAQTVRTAFEGTVATSIETLAGQLDFRVKIDKRYQRNRRFLQGLLIPNRRGRLIALDQVADLVKEEGQSEINHYNGDRVITITADIDKKMTTSSQAVTAVKEWFEKVQGKYGSAYLDYGGEYKETEESLSGLFQAFIAAVFMIYIILLVLFKSLSQPLLVMAAIPFGMIGALLGFTIHGVPLTFVGIVGIIGLSGVVVNDSIVMVEFINRSIRTSLIGKSTTIMRVVSGARQRFRPVIVTTTTTVMGLLPSVYAVGGDAKAILPIVIAMCYGLLFATLLTLVFIPVLYLVRQDLLGDKITKQR